jgi:hypothetical protein
VHKELTLAEVEGIEKYISSTVVKTSLQEILKDEKDSDLQGMNVQDRLKRKIGNYLHTKTLAK